MAIYKRYNTRRKKLDARIVFPVLVVAAVFLLTVLFGLYLGNKANGGEPLYTGTNDIANVGDVLAPLSEKSVRGEYVAPENLSKFEAENDEIWASTWLYKDGKALFATETARKLGENVKGLANINSFDISCGTLGLFEVSCIYSDAAVSGVICEYERALLNEFLSGGLDEAVLVFNDVTADNYKAALEFASSIKGAKAVCVPYAMIENQEFFAAAAERSLPVALLADGIKADMLENDIEKYAFYFTKYNIRLVLSDKDKGLIDILSKHTVLNYQFYS